MIYLYWLYNILIISKGAAAPCLASIIYTILLNIVLIILCNQFLSPSFHLLKKR